MKVRTLILQGIIFGVISGAFALGVQLVAIFAPSESSLMIILTGSMLEFLIIGSAGRRAGLRARQAAAGTGVGAVAGGLSELIHSVGGSIALALSPLGRAAFANLSVQAQTQASDPVFIGLNLALKIATVIGFGALFGWLGAWSALRFGTPTDRQS